MVQDYPGQDGKAKSDSRLDSLESQLKQVRQAEDIRTGKARKPAKGMRQGHRVLTELVAGPAGGALMGWLLDRIFNTAPWLMLACIFLGIAVAFVNIYRISNERPE